MRFVPNDVASMIKFSACDTLSCVARWVTKARKPSHHVKVQSPFDELTQWQWCLRTEYKGRKCEETFLKPVTQDLIVIRKLSCLV